MPSTTPEEDHVTTPIPAETEDGAETDDGARTDRASLGALAYAAGTLVRVDTRWTPPVSTLDLAAHVDLGGRSR